MGAPPKMSWQRGGTEVGSWVLSRSAGREAGLCGQGAGPPAAPHICSTHRDAQAPTGMRTPSLLAPSHPGSPGTRLLAPAPTPFAPSSPRDQFRVPGWNWCWGPQRWAAEASGTRLTSPTQAGLPSRRGTAQPHGDAHPGPLPSLGRAGGSPGQDRAALPEPGSSPIPLGEATHRLPPRQRFTSTRGINISVSGCACGR